jgi:hypothetical protein
VTTAPGELLFQLLLDYQAKITRSVWARYKSTPYSFSEYTDKTAISHMERRAYADLQLLEPTKAPKTPFSSPQIIKTFSRKSRLSLLQKYCRLIASNGFINGNVTLIKLLLIRKPKST